jgi:hypothetical protein
VFEENKTKLVGRIVDVLIGLEKVKIIELLLRMKVKFKRVGEILSKLRTVTFIVEGLDTLRALANMSRTTKPLNDK